MYDFGQGLTRRMNYLFLKNKLTLFFYRNRNSTFTSTECRKITSNKNIPHVFSKTVLSHLLMCRKKALITGMMTYASETCMSDSVQLFATLCIFLLTCMKQQTFLYGGLIKSLKPTLSLVGVFCVLVKVLSRECDCVLDLDGGQCLPLCTQHLQPHVQPGAGVKNTLTSAVSPVTQ